MSTLQPYLNLLILLTVLSIIAERATNLVKLRTSKLRDRREDPAGEKEREQGITLLSIIVGILVAVLIKANLFEILSNLDSPWNTLGWVQIQESTWIRTPASTGFGAFFYALAGCVK